MYYVVEHLLERGERVVIDGLRGSGKSTMIGKLSSRFNSYRSMWDVSKYASHLVYDQFQLFDRCNWIDRYAFNTDDEELLGLCAHFYKEYLSGTYLVLLFNDKWSAWRGDQVSDTNRKKFIMRLLKISKLLYENNAIKGLVVSTTKGWWSTDFVPIGSLILHVEEEENINGRPENN